jgi:hypothetical protein
MQSYLIDLKSITDERETQIEAVRRETLIGPRRSADGRVNVLRRAGARAVAAVSRGSARAAVALDGCVELTTERSH